MIKISVLFLVFVLGFVVLLNSSPDYVLSANFPKVLYKSMNIKNQHTSVVRGNER